MLQPRLLAEQFDEQNTAAVITRFAGHNLRVTYHNPTHLDYGQYVIQAVSIDGVAVPYEKTEGVVMLDRRIITALDGNATHDITVLLGEVKTGSDAALPHIPQGS